MKIKVFALAALGVTVGVVVINTILLKRQIGDTLLQVEAFDPEGSDALKDAEIIYDDFKKKEKFISLTVSHDDLMSIEDAFAEMIGYLSVDDPKGAEVSKNRLTDALMHLRRLSGFNIDAVI